MESWRQNLEYTLSLDANFAKFLGKDTTWQKKYSLNPLRGFTDDGELTAVQRSAQLDLMLGQIANYCPVISRNTIVKNSTSLAQIWQAIRLHYGFQTSGAHILDFAAIRRGANERPEDLFQRLTAVVEDSLLASSCGITHHDVSPTTDEDLTPTLENFIVLHWLELLHPGLPALVKQRYGPELRSRTLASLKPEVSQALDSLMAELSTAEDAKILRSAAADLRRTPADLRPYRGRSVSAGVQRSAGQAAQAQLAGSSGRPAAAAAAGSSRCPARPPPSGRSCALCQAAGRPGSTSHYLSRCRYLPEADRRFIMAGARLIAFANDEEDCEEDDFEPASLDSPEDCNVCTDPCDPARPVQPHPSPYLPVYCGAHPPCHAGHGGRSEPDACLCGCCNRLYGV